MAFDQRHRPPGAGPQSAAVAATPGKRSLAESWPVQHRAEPSGGPGGSPGEGRGDAAVHALAAHGLQGAPQALPHLDRIQSYFGRHDVQGIRAFVGGSAAAAAHGMGATAYATGDATAFAAAPDLHTAAHEAAHVLQQRDEVQLAGGVGARGDRYEQHADAIADQVVRGESAEALIDAGPGGARTPAVGGGPRALRPASHRTAVARQDGSGAPAPGGVPAGGTPVNQLGIVMWDGQPPLRLRATPAQADDNIVGELAFNTHLQVIARFPGDWLYVSTAAGSIGYAAAQFIWSAPEHPLPEPNARLHLVASGTDGTAIAIAQQYYGTAAGTWGSDLRFFINVLAAVNHLTVPSDTSGWQHVQFQAGQYIWVPSLAFARSMHGSVSSGSASYQAADSVGLSQALAGAAQLRADLARAIDMSQRYVPAAIQLHVAEDLQALLSGLGQMVLATAGILAISTAAGAVIGGGVVGAGVGFQCGMGIVQAMGMYFLAQWIASQIVAIGEAFAAFLSTVAGAHGSTDSLDLAALQLADAIGTLFGALVTALVMWLGTVAAEAAIRILGNTALGRALGATELGKFIARYGKKPTPGPISGEQGGPIAGEQGGPQTGEQGGPQTGEQTGEQTGDQTNPSTPPARVLPPDLQAIYDSLSDIAKQQFDYRLGRIADDPMNPTSSDLAKLRLYLDSRVAQFNGSYSAELEADWNRAHPAPGQASGPAAADLPQIRADGEALRGRISGAQPQLPGYDTLLRRLASQLDGPLARMESGATSSTVADVQGVRSNIDGINGEFTASLEPDVIAVSQQMTGNGQTADVDVVADRGAAWKEIKNTNPYSLQSTEWTGDAGRQGLDAQSDRLLNVARDPVNAVNGQAPRIVIQFLKGVGSDVAAALRAKGITVIGIEFNGPGPAAGGAP